MKMHEIAPGFTLVHGDAAAFLAEQSHGFADVTLTDPPYGIDGGRGSKSQERKKGEYDAPFDDTPEYIRAVIVPIVAATIARCNSVVVTPGNKCLTFYPPPQSFGCFYQPAAVGIQTFGNLDGQPIFYYGKNATKKNFGKPCSYVLTESPRKVDHPCPKPLGAWYTLLSNIALPGMTIFDPFLGSGTTGIAAARLGCNFIGVDISEKYIEMARADILKELSQPRLINATPEKPIQSTIF